MRWLRLVLTGLLLLLLSIPTMARGDDVKIPFLFTEDEKLAQTELRQAVPRSNALQADQFLNAPMTRLDYMLMKLEARLNGELAKMLTQEPLERGFDLSGRTLIFKPSVEGFARYNAGTGRVFVGLAVSDLGEPRRPMRTTCDELLAQLEYVAPQQIMGTLYHNNVLGILAQKNPIEYTPSLQALAKSIVHRVRLDSITENYSIVYQLACQRAEEDAPVVYHRSSRKIRSVR